MILASFRRLTLLFDGYECNEDDWPEGIMKTKFSRCATCAKLATLGLASHE